MFFRLCRAEIASAVPGCSTKNIITQRKFLRKFSEGRHMPRKRNFLKIFISFLKNRRKWGGVLFSPLCGQLPRRGSRGGRLSVCLKFFSNVNVAAPSSVNFVDSKPPRLTLAATRREKPPKGKPRIRHNWPLQSAARTASPKGKPRK